MTDGDHSSSPAIARGIEQPTRELPAARIAPDKVGNPSAALRGGLPLLPYLVLLRVGFTVPPRSPSGRCALTLIPASRAAPFHPYPSTDGRYVFCGTFRAGSVRPCGIPLRPSPLASTLPCGVRTFLSPGHARPDRIGALGQGSDHPAYPRKSYDSLPVRRNQTRLAALQAWAAPAAPPNGSGAPWP
jgi:hypothetical protein